MDDKIPKTKDGHIIYPNMPVYICRPYTTVQIEKATVYCVLADDWVGSTTGYYCVLVERRYYNGEYWEDGNTESTSVLFFNEAECLKEAKEIEKDLR